MSYTVQLRGLDNTGNGLTQAQADTFFVPYIGATADVNLGAHGITANKITDSVLGDCFVGAIGGQLMAMGIQPPIQFANIGGVPYITLFASLTNLQVTGLGKLDTIQDIQVTSSPAFAALSLGSGAGVANQVLDIYYGHLRFDTVASPTSAPTASLASGGAVDVGLHNYQVVYVTPTGDTSNWGGTPATATTTGGNQTVHLASIPVSTNALVTTKKIYRTKLADTNNYYLVATISNATTTYDDAATDASLPVVAGDNYNTFYKENMSAGQIYIGTAKSIFVGSVSNTVIGYTSGISLIDGYQLTLYGWGAGNHITSGATIISIGYQSGYALTTETNTVIVGTKALDTQTSGGNNNTVIGDGSLRSRTSLVKDSSLGSGTNISNGVDRSTVIGYGADCSARKNCIIGGVAGDGNENHLGIGVKAAIISDGFGIHLAGKILRLDTAKTPASASDTGNAGEICWDASYIYVCTATNTWKRTPILTWV